MEVGEGVSIATGPIRGICAAILNLRHFAFVVAFSLLIVLGGKPFWLYKCWL